MKRSGHGANPGVFDVAIKEERMSIDVSAITGMQLHPLPAALHVLSPKEKPAVHDDSRSEPSPSMNEIIKELTQVSVALNRRLSFSVNEKLGEMVVKVIDTQTDKIIREIPPVELQNVHERIKEVLGILFDERA